MTTKADKQAELDRLNALIRKREEDGTSTASMDDRSIGYIAYQTLLDQRNQLEFEIASFDTNGWGWTDVSIS